VEAYKVFTVDDSKAKPLRDAGFGTVLISYKRWYCQRHRCVVTLANAKENLVMIKERASAHYSFPKRQFHAKLSQFHDGIDCFIAPVLFGCSMV
jgi:hypothetical protein